MRQKSLDLSPSWNLRIYSHKRIRPAELDAAGLTNAEENRLSCEPAFVCVMHIQV